MDSEVVARVRNTTASPTVTPAAATAPAVAANQSDLAFDAIAALAGRRASVAHSGSASPAKKDRDFGESTIHASGLSPPPPPTAQPAQPSQPVLQAQQNQHTQPSAELPPVVSRGQQQQPSPVPSPPPKVRRPLPSAAPADLAASTGLIPGFPRRTSTAYVSGRFDALSCCNHELDKAS
ncbi:hypothetical protein SPBR_06199 [Sporothrix brasiliensis 5110]|uniref:Uncharacterized protein n=1 Tax=Sporothrix brasiliensis 5110 TaxID=1398154 RepID=A0A0C2JCA1_9PEZI|nr:uncharacterized protein SPBR_06199 [Sporothrix brasiliensis 5110]KIH94547.1 hypothetical protein SPBR_06199 [Sporothrix brasiliensis 5110]